MPHLVAMTICNPSDTLVQAWLAVLLVLRLAV